MKKSLLSLILIASFINPAYSKCLASYYADSFEGKRTATGSIFSNNYLTAASTVYPLHSKLQVKYKNKTVIVKVTDIGGYGCLDLTKKAFKKLGPLHHGILNVEVKRIR